MKNGHSGAPWIKGSFLVAVLLSLCCTTLKQQTESETSLLETNGGDREPASFCKPTAADLEQSKKITADPVKFEERRKILMNAQVQIYVLASELTYQFDLMLNQNVPIEKIYSSDVYMKLLALQEVRRSIRHNLENFFSVRVNQKAGINPTEAARTAAILDSVDYYQKEFENIVRSKPDSRFARIALVDIGESFEDLRLYYVSCKYTDLHRAFEQRMKKRRAEMIEIERSAPLALDAHKYFGPTPNQKGIDAAKLVDDAAIEIRNEVLSKEVRLPQSAQRIESDVGPSGNIFGKGFPQKTWALTYDDGPGATTGKVLDNLKKHDIKATFFMLSQQLKDPTYFKVAHRIQDEGHAIASHSMTHPQIPKLSESERFKEIVGAKKVFTEFFSDKPGDTPPEFFRLPYGAGVSVPSVRKIIADADMIHVFWNVDTLDWQDHDPQSIFERAVKQIQQLDHGIILFHDIHSQSVIASELLMRYLKDPENKIRTVTIPEIVDELNKVVPNEPVVLPTNESGGGVVPSGEKPKPQ